MSRTQDPEHPPPRRPPLLVAFLSLLVPGLGQMVSGAGLRGAAILLAVMVVGNQNAIWLSLYAATPDPVAFWSHVLPRLLHDLFALYGVIFWLWQVADAYRLAGRGVTTAPDRLSLDA